MTRSIVPGKDQVQRFAPRVNTEQVEEGHVLAPKFDAAGLITCVVTDVWSGDVLMVAHMNAEALARTIETGEAWYYSRSRSALWKKGEQSGHTQRVIEMRVDCDQDALWIRVEQTGPGACHTGRVSCFYRTVRLKDGGGTAVVLDFTSDKVFEPNKIYGKDDR
jgi:phosphoribosyl-AMP cyclohydrolase